MADKDDHGRSLASLRSGAKSKLKSFRPAWPSSSSSSSASAPASTSTPASNSTPPSLASTNSELPGSASSRSSSFKTLLSSRPGGKEDEKEGSKADSRLCKLCSNIDFDQFAPAVVHDEEEPPRRAIDSPTFPTTVLLLSLFDVIENSGEDRQGCAFCNLLLDAISLPANDPFAHPAIKDHAPPQFEGKTFGSWVSDLRGSKWLEKQLSDAHPFGKSRNKVGIEIDHSDPEGRIVEVQKDFEGKERSMALFMAASIPLGQIINLVTHNAMYRMILNNKLPVAIRIKIHNRNDAVMQGLLSISVHGYGCKVQASLSVLSSFNLRVASDYKEDELSLRYGGIMENRVNVEKDCRRWMDNCCQRHGELCGNPEWHKRLPLPSGRHFRLIEIDQNQDNMFKLVQLTTTTNMPQYAALSYVWGNTGAKALNLYQNNLLELSRRIPPEKLAKTIADAITVTRRLGLNYLWVDSLCIIQDQVGQEDLSPDPSPFDQMGSIYGHASVVIVGAGGEHADSGLAGISQDREPGQIAQEVKTGINVLLPVHYGDSYGKWDTRAWTLQEKLLSRRMLVFHKDHVSFQCRHGVLREDMPATHAGNGPPRMPYLSISPDHIEDRSRFNWDGSAVLLRSSYFDEYVRVIDQYTWRQRTNPNDIIRALLGLLNVLGNLKSTDLSQTVSASQGDTPQQQMDYRSTIYGLPEDFLDLALLWQPPAVTDSRLTKRVDDSFPSWSWAGWDVSSQLDPCSTDAEAYRARTGIRFEEPFHVSGNNDLSLRKFIASGDQAEERIRPMVMWYKWMEDRSRQADVTAELVPVNGSGLGVVCSDAAGEWFFKDPLRPREAGPPSVRSNARLDGRNIVCETQVGKFWLRPKLSLRKETLWKHGDAGDAVMAKELEIVEGEMINAAGTVVGHVIPTDQHLTINPQHPYHFILLSGSQYRGNEERVDVVGYPLYNVMMVEWDANKEFAMRLGVGKISRNAWQAENPSMECVILR